MNICKECKHYLPVDAGCGVCRRYPPVANGQSFFTSVYPKVESNNAACGEFDKREIPAVNKPNNNQRKKK